ncbi:MAG: DJ-1/PfpI family protein [Pseudomonadota bacterium]|nr:DJ-1/PfpI family protein [Pseudomonadota bacterium]
MRTASRHTERLTADERLIVIVAPPEVTLQDLTGPWEVFCRAALYRPGTYRVVTASAERDPQVSTKFGLSIRCHGSILDSCERADTVLVAGSQRGVDERADPAFLDWLRTAGRSSRRVGSICVGSFYLAQAGLLRGRSATTHWRFLAEFARQFPEVCVQQDPIFVRDGNMWTSAGVTAGIDLALAMVEEDCGSELALTIARDLVIFFQRQGNQSQVSVTLGARTPERRSIRDLQRWVPDRLSSFRSVAELARFVNMSPRNFSRHFKRETGISPGQYLRALRLEAARQRVGEGATKQDVVASQLGLASARSIRRLLKTPAAGAAHDRKARRSAR